ncbi:MAG: glycerate kinase type-2 family protein [Thermoproteota archaeon]
MLRILNKDELSRNGRKRDVLTILEEGLKAADPKKSVKDALNKLEGEIYKANRVFVIGFGKASLAMAEGCEEKIGDLICNGAIIVPERGEEKRLRVIKVLEGTHPIPSEINVDSTRRLISFCSNLTNDDLVLCLISGGGSSLLTLPAEGISLGDKRITTDILLKSGASIKEINIVRKHISRVKGGQLVNFLKPARVISLILSDIVGDPVEYIASGPTSLDPSTFEDAHKIMEKYNLKDKLPESVVERIKRGMRGEVPETPKPGDRLFNNVENIIVSNNMKSLVAMERKASELGYNTLILTSFCEGEAREVGKFLCAIMRQISNYKPPVKNPACLKRGGETTVTVRGNGKGGRNQELALSVVNNCGDMRNFIFASIGSDGIDGYTDAAGAIADAVTVEKVSTMGLSPKEFLDNNDSYNFFKQTGGLIFTGRTGTNVNDFTLIIIN